MGYGTHVYHTAEHLAASLPKKFFNMQGLLKELLSNNKFVGLDDVLP